MGRARGRRARHAPHARIACLRATAVDSVSDTVPDGAHLTPTAAGRGGRARAIDARIRFDRAVERAGTIEPAARGCRRDDGGRGRRVHRLRAGRRSVEGGRERRAWTGATGPSGSSRPNSCGTRPSPGIDCGSEECDALSNAPLEPDGVRRRGANGAISRPEPESSPVRRGAGSFRRSRHRPGRRGRRPRPRAASIPRGSATRR